MIDPIYPKTIKTPLYQADEYQTYDLLFWDCGVFVNDRKVAINKIDYLFTSETNIAFYEAQSPGLRNWAQSYMSNEIDFNTQINPYEWAVTNRIGYSFITSGVEPGTKEEIINKNKTLLNNQVLRKGKRPIDSNQNGEWRWRFPGQLDLTFPVFADIQPFVKEVGFASEDELTWNGRIYNLKIVGKNSIENELSYFNENIVQIAICFQRFSVWNYPWAEGFIQKLYNFLSATKLTFNYTNYFKYGDAVDRQNSSFAINSKIIEKSIFTFTDYQFKLINSFIEFNSSIQSEIVLTYLYRDTSTNNIACYSKGYIRFFVKEGENKIYLNWMVDKTKGLYIIPGSMVVSSYPYNESLINLIINQINNNKDITNNELSNLYKRNNISKNAEDLIDLIWYKNFDKYALEASQTLYTEQTNKINKTDYMVAETTINPSNFSAIYFANNNYWNNGVIYDDVNPIQPLSPRWGSYIIHASFETIQAQYNAKYSDNRIDKNMPDSVRIQEIHAALEAQKYSKSDTSNDARIANLGYYIERIAQILGISVNSDGTIRSIRPKRRIPDGTTIPGGWNFGQFGYNERGNKEGQLGGNKGEFANGIVYQQISNKLKPDKYNSDKSEIEGGDNVLCENWIQYFSEYLDDLDKALGWQELGAGAIPSADGSEKFMTFEGSASLLTELLFMLSRVSTHTSQALISSNITQATAKECLQGLGLPVESDYAEFNMGNDKTSLVPFPALAPDSPTITQQLGWILANLGHLIAANVNYLDTKGKGA
jgi:hypothetical protein